jgi:hypothetical protein
MHAIAAHTETQKEAPPSADKPCCPLCNNVLIPLRGFFRCSRCFFTLCAGCEASPTGAPDACE